MYYVPSPIAKGRMTIVIDLCPHCQQKHRLAVHCSEGTSTTRVRLWPWVRCPRTKKVVSVLSD
jgi:hypothetical protein